MKTEVTKYEDGELVIAVEGQIDVNTAPVFSEDVSRIRADSLVLEVELSSDHSLVLAPIAFSSFLRSYIILSALSNTSRS